MIFKISFKNNLSLLHPKNVTIFNVVHFATSVSASKTLNPSPKSNPLTEYLISSCGLSLQKAATASKSISKSTSVEQADSVRHFFKHHGFADTSIRKLISSSPRVLSADIGRTLQPNLRTLREIGFTAAELELLVSSSSRVLVNPLVIPRLEFWQNFLRTDSLKDLVSVIKRNRGLITHDIVSGIGPKISLLKEHGLSERDIVGLVKRGQGFITRSSKTIEAVLKSAKELGLDTKSPMYGQVLSSLVSFSSDSLKAKMQIFKGFGWSEEEFLAAFKKAPLILHLSEENIQEKMEFLVGRAGCVQSYIVSHPLLLMFSLNKRLKPRYCVMEILKSNGLVGRWKLASMVCLPEKRFVDLVLCRCEEKLPKIQEIYAAACSGEVPLWLSKRYFGVKEAGVEIHGTDV